jgi:hypothetical protein
MGRVLNALVAPPYCDLPRGTLPKWPSRSFGRVCLRLDLRTSTGARKNCLKKIRDC